MILEVWLERKKASILKFKARASVDGDTVVEANLLCTTRTIL